MSNFRGERVPSGHHLASLGHRPPPASSASVRPEGRMASLCLVGQRAHPPGDSFFFTPLPASGCAGTQCEKTHKREERAAAAARVQQDRQGGGGGGARGSPALLSVPLHWPLAGPGRRGGASPPSPPPRRHLRSASPSALLRGGGGGGTGAGAGGGGCRRALPGDPLAASSPTRLWGGRWEQAALHDARPPERASRPEDSVQRCPARQGCIEELPAPGAAGRRGFPPAMAKRLAARAIREQDPPRASGLLQPERREKACLYQGYGPPGPQHLARCAAPARSRPSNAGGGLLRDPKQSFVGAAGVPE